MRDASIVAAFDEDYAAKLSGISKQQLSYWCTTGFFVPAHTDSGRTSFSRIYSFRDIVALRVINVLRNKSGVSLQHLREVSDRLGENRWTGYKLYVVKKRVVWIDPDSELPQEIVSGQYIVPTIIVDDIVSDTKKDIDKFTGRNAKTFGKISRSRYINHNALVVSGTRIRVSAIKAFSDAGYSVAQIIEEYPELTEEDVRAAISYNCDKAVA